MFVRTLAAQPQACRVIQSALQLLRHNESFITLLDLVSLHCCIVSNNFTRECKLSDDNYTIIPEIMNISFVIGLR